MSKVAMSICALTVVSVLGGVFGPDLLLDRNGDLERMLADLTFTTEAAARARKEGTIVWRVPFRSSGEAATVSVNGSLFKAESGGKEAVLQASLAVHTWVWNGTRLNESTVNTLDEGSLPVSSGSGHTFKITTRLVSCENDQALLTFVSSCT